ncbi:glycosyltransferase [Pseudoalteromonas mariniglutinosa]
MKVTFLNSSYLPSKGGVENSLYFLSRESIKVGNKTIIIAGGKNDEMYVDSDGVEVVRYKSPSTFIKRSCSLFKILKSIDSDVFISRSFYTTVIALLAQKKVIYVLPAIFKNQNSPRNISNNTLTYKFIYKFNCFLEMIAIKKSDKVFVFSESMARQVKELGVNNELYLCHPGVDISVYNPASLTDKTMLRAKYDLPNDKKLLLGLGRMVQIKGFHHAIESMQYLDDSFHLVLVGDGTYKKELLSLIENLNLGGRVTFFNFTNTPQEFYKLADIFMMTSLYEPFGQVILEAVACGLKVVSFSNCLESIETATEEIFIGSENLSFKAAELTALSLSNTINEAAKKLDCDCTDEYNSFIKKFSWKQLFNDLCNTN